MIQKKEAARIHMPRPKCLNDTGFHRILEEMVFSKKIAVISWAGIIALLFIFLSLVFVPHSAQSQAGVCPMEDSVQ